MILVTLGTQDKQFYRILEALEDKLDKHLIDDEVVVQAGCSADFKSKYMKIFDLIPMDEFDEMIKKCDLLITHGGVGSIITGLKNNKKVIDLAKKYINKGVVAIDLDGAEGLFKTSDYKDLFKYAKDLNIPFTIHAGEADGISSIKSAIQFGSKRIGHGIRAVEDINLLEEIKLKKILLEICPTSNIQTNATSNIFTHPIRKIFDFGCLVSVNTDNRTVSNTSLNKEYKLIMDNLNFSIDDLIKINEYSIMNSFADYDTKLYILNKIKINIDSF